MDVLGTSIEAILSRKATKFSDALAIQAIQTVSKNLRTAVADGSNIHARYEMSLGAMFSGLVSNTPAAVNISHCIAEIIGPLCRIPHGEAVAIATPHGMRFNQPECHERLAMIAEAMGLDTHGLSKSDAGSLAIQAVRQLSIDIGLRTSYESTQLTAGKLQEIAEFIIGTQQEAYGLAEINPVRLQTDNVRDLLVKMCS